MKEMGHFTTHRSVGDNYNLTLFPVGKDSLKLLILAKYTWKGYFELKCDYKKYTNILSEVVSF